MSDRSLAANELLDLATDVVLHRVSGAQFAAIAMLHDISIAKARYYCKRARLRGYVSSDDIGHRPTPKPLRFEDWEYPAHWYERTKRNCIVDSNGCWLWQGSKTYRGYGSSDYRGKNMHVHRRMYMVVHGLETLDSEQDVCHSCDVRACCNPDHLWLGDAHTNLMDSVHKRRHRCARATECPRGHPYDQENTYVAKTNGARGCKKCQRGRHRVRIGWPEELAYSAPAGYVREVLP